MTLLPLHTGSSTPVPLVSYVVWMEGVFFLRAKDGLDSDLTEDQYELAARLYSEGWSATEAVTIHLGEIAPQARAVRVM